MSEKNLNVELTEGQLDDVSGGIKEAFRNTFTCPRCGYVHNEPVTICVKCLCEIMPEAEAVALKAGGSAAPKARAL